jgi:tetratricopeptide (TPR) repeat protein
MDSSPFHGKNPFEVLGLHGTEDAAAIRKAFLRIAAQSHPDRLRMKSEEEKAQALETFLLAKKAFELLSQPDKRREWSERLTRETPRTPIPPVTPPRTPLAPVMPPREASSASVRSGPSLTPALGTPIVPRPGMPPVSPSRGVPLTSPLRPGPSLTPALGTPLASLGAATAPTPPSPRTPSTAVQTPGARGGPLPSTAVQAPGARSGPLPAAAALQLYKLGMLALESSDYAKALDLFSKAAKLAPTPRHQAMELVGRGHQYLSTRFLDRARESFERALQLQPDCREARLALDVLDKQSGRPLKGR